MSPEDEKLAVEWAKHYSSAPTYFKSIIVACATLHFYYTVTHFDEEVEYIWSRKWTVGKIMYLLTRYLGTIFLIFSAVGVSPYAWNEAWFGIELLFGDDAEEPSILKSFIPTCFHGQLFSGFGPMMVLITEVILQMRVYALYGRDKRLLAFFILLTISLFGFNILQMSYLFLNVEEDSCGFYWGCFNKRSISRRAFIAHPLLDRYTCLETVPISGIGWSVTAFTELLLFLLVIIKARKRLFKSREQAMRHDIRTSMAKDSFSYFAVMLTVCSFGAVVNFVPENIDDGFTEILFYQANSYETIAITVMTILASRLIVNLREEVYGPSEITESQLTWNADALGYISSGGSVGDSNDAYSGMSSSSDPERL